MYPLTTLPSLAFSPLFYPGFMTGVGSPVPVASGTGGSSYAGTTAAPPKDLKPLSEAFRGQVDRPLSLEKNFDKLARELAVRNPQLLAMVAPFKSVPNATFTIARVKVATAGGPGMTETIRISTPTKATTGGPSGKAPTGADLSFNFASLGLTLVIDQVLATKIHSPYKRGGLILGSYALASRIGTGSWAPGKGALKGFVQFHFFNEVTTSALQGLGITDPKALAYGSAGITAATMLTHAYMKRGADVSVKAVSTVAEARGASSVLARGAGKAFWALQVLDIGGAIAEDLVYDSSDNRTAIYLNYERDEMRSRTPTGLKWTTNFSLVRWPMRWFGGADESASRKADQYIAGEVVPQLNSLAYAAEGLLLSEAAKAVSAAQLRMVDPCLEEIAEKDVNPKHTIRTQCTIAFSENLLDIRKKELTRVGIVPKDKTWGGMDPAMWSENPWATEGVWHESDESLRFQYWEHLAKRTVFLPNLELGDFNSFKDAYNTWNDTVSGLEPAKPWNALTAFLNARGEITNHRAFGEYLKEPVRKHCDTVAADMKTSLVALAETCFNADGGFDQEKFQTLVTAYYRGDRKAEPDIQKHHSLLTVQDNAPQDGIQEFYDLLVIDSVHGGESKGQDIAGVIDVHGRIKDKDNLMLFLMKAFHERNARADGEFRQVLMTSGLNPDLAVTTDPATGAVLVKTDLMTPGIEQSIRDKGGDEIARNMLLDPARIDALYDNLTSPLSREWIDKEVLGIPSATAVAVK